ncbi:hypothetical protein [Myroides sp. LoEW2-1]|uniref:hypothetical protein n=1 Tax=Myroides sp. LoEW2-1 TaxID=2683192 RepID=UPI001324771B|nr:hypothetical protein [Myroides sp. LoEW2-1]MVX36240.1 hypothetical protein [Myroides sp. LoEW2-1]
MKKLFMFLAVAGLATFGVSCSSDDNSSDSGKESKQLVLSADRVDVKEGDLVKFTVQADKKNVDGAKIYVDGVEAGIEHVFEKEGTFNVVAKKANFEDSAALKITVTKKDGTDPDTEKKTFTLVADKADVKVGETVTFSAKENNVAISGFKVKVVGGAELPGLTWKAEKEGVVKFIATKDGYNDTAEITVNVTKDEAPKGNFMSVNGKNFDIDEASTKLLAETIIHDGENYIRLYSLDTEEGKIFYCRFAVDVRTKNFAIAGENVTGAVSRVYKIVIQDEASEEVFYPGMDPNRELNVNGFVLSENGDVDFKGEEVITQLDVKLKEFADKTGNVKATVKDDAQKFELKYDGNIAAMYSIDTTNQPDAKGTKSFNHSSNMKNVSISKGQVLSKLLVK